MRISLGAGALLLCVSALSAQTPPANYDEASVPAYELPAFARPGPRVPLGELRGWWQNQRRAIRRSFESEVYGRVPGRPPGMHFVTTSVDSAALGGRATRKQVTIYFSPGVAGPKMDLLLYLPNAAPAAVPVFLGLNFYGNHSVHDDPGVALSRAWMRENPAFGIVDNRATEASRGSRAGQWPVERILERGYGLVTAYYGDLDPDFHDGFRNGVHPLFYRRGQTGPAPDEWGSIGAWAWGLIRAMDYLEKDPAVDGSRVAVMGHSRIGKAALWAGALDPRFAMVISNNSGAGGAALSGRIYGETVEHLNTQFPHWFAGNFKKYSGNESQLPVDQHMLLALIAPRPLYVASAQEDQWADPRGEFLSAMYASEVYRLLGRRGLPVVEMPAVGVAVMGDVGYHVRPGKHDVTMYDWERYMDFADLHFQRPARPR